MLDPHSRDPDGGGWSMQINNELSGAVTVLSAMITPAVLISACGSLIVATSTRLGRVIDRTRTVSGQFEEVAHDESDAAFAEERRALLYGLVGRLTKRSRLIQRAMVRLYMALGFFVATSVAIGIVAVTGREYAWLPILLGLAGAGLLLSASVLLIRESRIALASIHDEMDFVVRLGRHHAPSALLEQEAEHGRLPFLRRPHRGPSTGP